jgi:hypothetical protein
MPGELKASGPPSRFTLLQVFSREAQDAPLFNAARRQRIGDFRAGAAATVD